MIKARPKTKRATPDEQHAKFVELANEVDADESPGALDRAFGKIDPKKREAKPVKPKRP